MGILPRFADQWVLTRILKATGQAPIRLVVKDGADVSPSGISPVATMLIRDRGTLAGLLRDPEVNFGDAYMDGRIDVEGDLVCFWKLSTRRWKARRPWANGTRGYHRSGWTSGRITH